MIDKQHKEDINIPNGPFCLFEKCFPNTTIRYPPVGSIQMRFRGRIKYRFYSAREKSR